MIVAKQEVPDTVKCHMTDEENELNMLQAGGAQAVAVLFMEYRARLKRTVNFRLDARLCGRVDASDVLQEAYLESARRADQYLNAPNVPFFVWLRQIAIQILIDTHRQHLGAQKRDVRQEVAINRHRYPNATSVSIAGQLVNKLASPSQSLQKRELLDQLRHALDEMDEVDREVIALRHFEGLKNNEIAEILGITKAGASNKYVRALKRLREIMASLSIDPNF